MVENIVKGVTKERLEKVLPNLGKFIRLYYVYIFNYVGILFLDLENLVNTARRLLAQNR